VPPAMTGVPSRAAQRHLSGRSGRRLAPGKEQARWSKPSAYTWSPVKELANPSPLSLAAPFQPPNHATKGSRLQVFLLKAKGGLVWGATIYVLFS